METTANVRTMEFIGKDFWGMPVYKCSENGTLWKDITLGKGNPELYSCGNDLDGEPNAPIGSDIVVTFKTKYEESPYRFNYMMLSRLKSDCEFFLGFGGRNKRRLSGESVEAHIERMKELHNSFPEDQKPEWLTYEAIIEYEKRMSE